MENSGNAEKTTPEATIGRNEPCPCGSGKKYKRCHGVGAAPQLSTPKMPAMGDLPAGAAGGLPFDPSQMDPQMMAQVSQALQRLPRGQLQRLQSIMQRAMAGKDVTREAEEFQRTLPPEFQNLMMGFQGQMASQMGGMPGAEIPEQAEAAMSEEEARKIVEAAMKEGKISEDQAQELLSAPPGSPESESDQKEEGGSKLSKLWRSVRGK